MSDRWWNQNGLEESRKEVQSFHCRKRNQRTGIGDDGHSELLAGIQFAAQFLTAELEVRDPLRGGLSDEVFPL